MKTIAEPHRWKVGMDSKENMFRQQESEKKADLFNVSSTDAVRKTWLMDFTDSLAVQRARDARGHNLIGFIRMSPLPRIPTILNSIQ